MYTAEPFLRRLAKLNLPAHVVAPRALLSNLLETGTVPRNRVAPLEMLAAPYRRLARLHELAALAITSRHFSMTYATLLHPGRGGLGWKYVLAYYLTRPFPKWRRQEVNRTLRKWFSNRVQNVFPSRRIVAISKATHPLLLCAPKLKVATLVESWDHAALRPAGYPSDLAVVWNQDLAADWTHYQGDCNVTIGYPIKLSYMLQNPIKRRSAGQEGRPPTLMYACGATSQSPRRDWYRDELKLIDIVCRVTRRLGWRLLIKPKPVGTPGEYDSFTHQYSHVAVGTERLGVSAVDYDLSEAYNEARRSELSQVDFVLNCWTTFALDAACAGVPVIQLDLRGQDSIPSLSRAYAHDHVTKYLLREPSEVLRPRSGLPLDEELAAQLRDLGDRAIAFSRRLATWVRPAHSRDQAIADTLDRFLTF